MSYVRINHLWNKNTQRYWMKEVYCIIVATESQINECL
jgi:hypothetical protein